jgi:PD-(D/E)XK endonuclease
VSRSYRGYADYIGVFCPDNGQVYLVPVADVPDRTANLRVDPPRNGQTAGLRWAKNYVIWPTSAGDAAATYESGRCDDEISVDSVRPIRGVL